MTVTWVKGNRPLQDIRVIVYDLDGTLYDDRSHFDYYARRLRERIPSSRRERFWDDYVSITEGRHPLRFGMIYDARADLLVEADAESRWILAVRRWDGTEISSGQIQDSYPEYPKLPATDMTSRLFIGDLWWVPAAAALHHGVDRAAVHQAFMDTRDFMSGPQYRISPVPGLRQCLAALKASGITQLLATNSPEPDSRALLAQLGLEDTLDGLRFDCNKPLSSERLFTEVAASTGVAPAQLLSVGDNYHNEIVPAHEIGARTLFIDPHGYLHSGRWDLRVRTIPEAVAALQAIPACS